MNYKKYILTLTTILLFISPFFITGYLIVKKQLLKYTYEERFENKRKETFTINKNEVVWIKKDKEILINHHIFDIKKIKYIENKIIVTGWFDEEEQEVDNQIAKNNKLPNQKNIVHIFNYTFFENYNTHIINNPTIIANNKLFGFYQSYLINNYKNILTPPPKV